MCPAEVTCSSCWSHPSLYHISKKGWCIFLMPRGFACWSYKLSGGLETGQPTASMPKPERGQVLTGWLKARMSRQKHPEGGNCKMQLLPAPGPTELWIKPGASALHADNLISTTLALGQKPSLSMRGNPSPLNSGEKKVHCSCTLSFHTWCASGPKEKRPAWLGGPGKRKVWNKRVHLQPLSRVQG